MRYKFIGTEQDLIDNGFRLVQDYELNAIRQQNGHNLFLDKKNELLSLFIENDIQDLIDKGLVEVVE